ncbi:MAG: NAD-dependent succinate-semialdehyde dehydrogenase [Rubellimicrobium sp.]|nr:NAD-dependent succinate-semialdehyde dehydrogenase [Rubellimicrobium sp.]
MTPREVPLFIDGQWRMTPDTLPVIDPATEDVIARVAVAREGDLTDAIAAAERGFALWSRTGPADRAAVILRAAAILRAGIADIARDITLENGKPLAEAEAEVIRGCEFLEWDAGEAVRDYGRIVPSRPGIRYLVVHEPIGPVAAFSPWNFPMSQPARKIAGALAAGCSVIMKASEETPTGVLHIARALADAGLPAGVLNLVFGVPAAISTRLIPDPAIRAIAFTGSTAVGRVLTEMAGRHLKPALMELGGHAPVIVCADADPVAAGQAAARRKYRNAGQVCTSPTRFYVDRALCPAFTDAFVATAAALRVGPGAEAGVQMGPVANDRRVAELQRLTDDAVNRGARLLLGGVRLNRPGYFFPPTALADVPDGAEVFSTEPFGPLAVINAVDTLDEAIARANALPYGLAAYGFTRDAAHVERLMSGLQAGNVSINTLEASVAEVPFGGVKDSGLGREGGVEGLHHYRTVKTVSLAQP